MSELTLRPMTTSEFDIFRSREIREYAIEQVSAGYWIADDAEMRAAEQTDSLLPQGIGTPEMLLLIAENAEGVAIGHAWVALKPGSGTSAWLYDIRVDMGQRGNGYGRAILRAVEQEITQRGIGAIGMNVFGSNMVARNLYETAGYQIKSMHLQKKLLLTD